MTERNWNGVSGISAGICRIFVPVGLSKYRDGLYPLEPFTKEDAQNVLECVHRWQKMLYAEYGLHFIHCSDEWYILAEQSMPPEEQYDGYLQLENGVGMLRLLDTEIREAVQGLEGNDTLRHFSVATGKLDHRTGSDRTAERSGSWGTASDPVQYASCGRKCVPGRYYRRRSRRSVTDKNHCGK